MHTDAALLCEFTAGSQEAFAALARRLFADGHVLPCPKFDGSYMTFHPQQTRQDWEDLN